MRKVNYIVAIIATILLIACNADTYEKKGDKSLALGEYYLAADYYKQAYARTPNTERIKRGERALKMAKCYERFNNAQNSASKIQLVAVADIGCFRCDRPRKFPWSVPRNLIQVALPVFRAEIDLLEIAVAADMISVAVGINDRHRFFRQTGSD